MTGLSQIHSVAAQLSGSGVSQHARLITLATAQGTKLPESLVVERFFAREGVNELFHFEIDAVSVSASIDLMPLIGEEITLRLLQPDGSRRAWHGYCTEAGHVGADGGLARYRLRLEPALSFLRYRRDNYIFQDKHAGEIIAELLADHPQVRFRLNISQEMPVRPICTQYRESDLDFLLRLLASEGLSFRFTHDQHEQDDQSDEAGPHALHELVIFDSAVTHPPLPGSALLRFHGVRATDEDDAINRFSAIRQVQSNAVALSSWDETILHATAAEQVSALDAGALPHLPVHDGSLNRRFPLSRAAEACADRSLKALELGNKLFHGEGSVRRLAPGHAFTLSQHEHYLPAEDSFIVLWVEHAGANNLDARTAALVGPGDPQQRGTYRNTFICLRASVPIVPNAAATPMIPAAPGAQIGLVVGLPDAAMTTHRDHQVKVQFPWQRGTTPNPGGLSETGSLANEEGNAPGNDRSGTWVRVSEALAGPNWGTNFVPRIGSDVLVDFIEGDIDRPVIVSQLYNGVDIPPCSAGIDSGVNHAGVISGVHSRALHGNGYNQWIVDDAQGQLRMRLATSTAASQLNLGYLIAQSPHSAQRGAYRGSGFELRSDGWAVLRAGAGLLLTTTLRPVQAASVTSTQMDAGEAIGLLKGAQGLSERVSEAARMHQARVSQHANDAQDDFLAMIDPERDGKYKAAVNGQEARRDAPGGRQPDAPVEKFAQPLILMDSPTTINWASPASALLFAGRHVHWNTQGDLQLTTAHTSTSVTGQSTSLFSQAGGIQAYAANGPLSIAAHTASMEMLADQAVTVTSVDGHVAIKAREKVSIVAGQSSVVLEGANISFTCPGQFSAKGAQRVFAGPATKAALIEMLPDTQVKLFDEAFVLLDPDGKPLEGVPYQIETESGKHLAETAPEGRSARFSTKEQETLKFALQWHTIEK